MTRKQPLNVGPSQCSNARVPPLPQLLPPLLCWSLLLALAPSLWLLLLLLRWLTWSGGSAGSGLLAKRSPLGTPDREPDPDPLLSCRGSDSDSEPAWLAPTATGSSCTQSDMMTCCCARHVPGVPSRYGLRSSHSTCEGP